MQPCRELVEVRYLNKLVTIPFDLHVSHKNSPKGWIPMYNPTQDTI